MKCSNKECKKEIPKGKQAYWHGSTLCRFCYNKKRKFKAYTPSKMWEEWEKQSRGTLKWK